MGKDIQKESWRRNHGGGIMKDKSWRKNMEEKSWRRRIHGGTGLKGLIMERKHG